MEEITRSVTALLSTATILKRDVVSPICAVLFDSYAAMPSLSMLLASVHPLSKSGATTIATLYLCAILWGFAAHSPFRKWLTLASVILSGAMT